jgi:hypothetical protein
MICYNENLMLKSKNIIPWMKHKKMESITFVALKAKA